MSERRRAPARGEPAPAAPTDQKVWGRAETGTGSPDPYRTGSYGGYRSDSPGLPGYPDDPRSYRDDSYPGPPEFEGARGRRHGEYLPPDEDPFGPPPDADLYAGDPPRRRRRGRGGDEPEGDRDAQSGRGVAPRDGYHTVGDRRRPGNRGERRHLGVGGWISIVLTSVLVIGTLTAYKVYRSTLGLISRERSTDELDRNRPVNQTGAINVLLVGSDSRAGANRRYGPHLNDGERTDTIMLLHVSPNRDAATLLSFPRDSMVMIPICKNAQNAVVPQHLGMINSAFTEGGMICTRRTIETLTGIPIDHYVKVDFTGFKNIVNALGGIEICLPQDVNDPKSKLVLPRGRHIVRGETALAYVRMRHGLGDGSDISRIKRQQVFIAQVVKKATSRALLTDLGKLNAFITAAAASVTMDDALNTEALLQIAQSASKLTASGFKATTVPWEPYVADKNRVQWKQPAANNLFTAIRGDTEVIPSPTPSAAASATGPGGGTGPAVTKPSQVKVQVFNGTNIDGKARDVAETLSAQGFRVTGIGDARHPDGTDQPKTMIRYAGQGWDYAKILAGKLLGQVTPETGKLATGPVTPFTPSSPAPDVPRGRVPGPVIQLVIGADWKGVRIPLQVGENAVTAETNICAS